jgi:hypothetical protein
MCPHAETGGGADFDGQDGGRDGERAHFAPVGRAVPVCWAATLADGTSADLSP